MRHIKLGINYVKLAYVNSWLAYYFVKRRVRKMLFKPE